MSKKYCEDCVYGDCSEFTAKEENSCLRNITEWENEYTGVKYKKGKITTRSSNKNGKCKYYYELQESGH